VPLLGAVPRWLFEASRLVLLLAALATLGWAAALAVKNRRQLHGAAFLWFGIAVSTAAVCLLRWISMTFPFFA
jgi:hypothetical protein